MSLFVAILDSIITDFDEENKHLSVENHIALHNMLTSDFKEAFIKRVSYDFDF